MGDLSKKNSDQPKLLPALHNNLVPVTAAMPFTVGHVLTLSALWQPSCHVMASLVLALQFVNEEEYGCVAAFYSLMACCKLGQLLSTEHKDKELPGLAPWFSHRTPEFLQEVKHMRFELLPDHTGSRHLQIVEGLPKASDGMSPLCPSAPSRSFSMRSGQLGP